MSNAVIFICLTTRSKPIIYSRKHTNDVAVSKPESRKIRRVHENDATISLDTPKPIIQRVNCRVELIVAADGHQSQNLGIRRRGHIRIFDQPRWRNKVGLAIGRLPDANGSRHRPPEATQNLPPLD